MRMQPLLSIRPATPQDNTLIAEHFYQMWIDLDVPADQIAPNWQEIVCNYIEDARQNLDFQAFVATIAETVVGSVSCQRFAGPYPLILKPGYRCDGYIWGVYVEPDARNQGIATQLTQQAIAHLTSIGCTHAVLNASPPGKPVYSRLGFVDSNAMRLNLT